MTRTCLLYSKSNNNPITDIELIRKAFLSALKRYKVDSVIAILSDEFDAGLISSIADGGVEVHAYMATVIDSASGNPLEATDPDPKNIGAVRVTRLLTGQSYPHPFDGPTQISKTAMGAVYSHCSQKGLVPRLLSITADPANDDVVVLWKQRGGKVSTIHPISGALSVAKYVRPLKGNTLEGNFDVEEKISKAIASAYSGLPEATILYCSGILENYVKAAATKVGISPYDNVHNLIEELYTINSLGYSQRLAANIIRQTGNEIRHVMREPANDEEWLALALIKNVLRWYFEIHEKGVELDLFDSPFDGIAEDLLNPVTVDALQNRYEIQQEKIHRVSTLALAFAERFIDFEDYSIAREILGRCLATSGQKGRYVELLALLEARSGNPEKAITILSPKAKAMNKKSSQDVSETLGILGGAYKRMWKKTGDATYLDNACKAYATAWDESKVPYVGINAAACLSWLGKSAKAREIANSVVKRIDNRSNYDIRFRKNISEFDFYTLATLAEANWLLNNSEKYQMLHKLALGRGSELPGALEVYLAQMSIHASYK